jgi:hypothetical protein
MNENIFKTINVKIQRIQYEYVLERISLEYFFAPLQISHPPNSLKLL